MVNYGAIIVIAFPETRVVQVNMWYDKLTKLLRFNKNEHYIAGHSAAILIDHKTKKGHYFDFGRYHTPPKHGRIRDEESDPELRLKTIAKFDNKEKLLNTLEFIKELSQNPASHGDGSILYSTYNKINFNTGFTFAKNWQAKGAIPYGPFELKGTNCSRFVSKLIRATKPDLKTQLRLIFPKLTTASTIGNVKNILKKNSYFTHQSNINIPSEVNANRNLNRTLSEPQKPTLVPKKAQWLSGEGAGSWFHVVLNSENFKISRYSPIGVLEFKKEFKGSQLFDINQQYQFSYLSTGLECSIIQNNKNLIFRPKIT